MSSHPRESRVSDEAVEAVARERWMRERVRARTERDGDLAPWDHLFTEVREQGLHEARQDLEAALPYIEVELKERLLSRAALQAGADAFYIEKPATEADRNEVRIGFEAAFAALQTQEESP